VQKPDEPALAILFLKRLEKRMRHKQFTLPLLMLVVVFASTTLALTLQEHIANLLPPVEAAPLINEESPTPDRIAPSEATSNESDSASASPLESIPSTTQTQQSAEIRALTITQRQTFTPVGGGASVLRATRTRYQRSNGTFASVVVLYNENGTVSSTQTTVGAAGRGLFRVNEGTRRLVMLSRLPGSEEQRVPSETTLREDARFAREDTVLNYRTIVLRTSGDNEQSFTEFHYAPQLGGALVKVVSASSEGQEVTEPTQIVPGEPDFTLFQAMLNYPVEEARPDERSRRSF
jgi:hypothetical protein